MGPIQILVQEYSCIQRRIHVENARNRSHCVRVPLPLLEEGELDLGGLQNSQQGRGLMSLEYEPRVSTKKTPTSKIRKKNF